MKKIYAILINLFICLSAILVTFYTTNQGTVAGQVDTGQNIGWRYLATFTLDSNIFLGFIAGITAFKENRNFKSGTEISTAATIWYLVASTSTMLTFVVVLTFLAPLRAVAGQNYFDMFRGPMFFFHFLNPVLSAINFIFFMDRKVDFLPRFLTLIPVSIYAVVYAVEVCILHHWVDFYHFTFGGRYYLVPVVFIIICLVVFGIANLLAILHNRYAHRKI